MKQRKHKKEPLSKKIVGRFDLPEDVVFDVPYITMFNNTEIRIENYQSVLEYESEGMKLVCKEKLISLTGTGLAITLITDDEVSIKGTIESITFTNT